MIAVAQRRLWRALAESRRRLTRAGSERPALDSLGNPDRRHMDEFLRLTQERHDDYRTSNPIPPDPVCVICVSMRPENVRAVAAQVGHQEHPPADVVFVANGPGFDLAEVRDAFPEAHVIAAPSGTSLGAGLNLAMDATDARFIAKFDDDDLYGAHYLSDSVRAHGYSGAGIVGKHSYYVSLGDPAHTRLRFPGHDFSYSGTLAGGSLVIDRGRVGDMRFADISLGEDRDFIARCHRRGFSTFSGDRFNFMQCRTGSNTWLRSDDDFIRESVAVTDEAAINR